MEKTRDFIDDNVIDHDDGEDLREELLDEYNSALDELGKAESDLDDIDVGSSDGAEELARWVQNQDDYDMNVEVGGSLDDLANEIDDRMTDLDDDCSSGILG